jgi:hypothetical protein
VVQQRVGAAAQKLDRLPFEFALPALVFLEYRDGASPK